MKRLINQLVGLSFLIIMFIVSSCKKSIFLDDRNEKIPVIINLSGFTSSQSEFPRVANLSSKLAESNTTNHQTYIEGNLYYWSFNDDSLEPDVKYQQQHAPQIIYNGDRTPSSFVNSTYTYEGYIGGRALTLTGPSELLFKLPIKDISSLSSFGFDIGSSNTGPKTFSIAYSVDQGQTFHTLIENNQFSSFTANAKQSFVYNLAEIALTPSNEIQLKLIFSAGDRGTSSDFNPTSGSLRIDNVYLKGKYANNNNSHLVNKVHYYFFNRLNNKLTTGELYFSIQTTLNLELEYGQYDFFIVSNNSNEELIIPDAVTKNSLSISSYFRNSQAEIFGYTGELTVEEPLTTNIELGRLFSQIKVEFTDPGSLDHIERLVVKQVHQPFQYFPFINSGSTTVQDQSNIIVQNNLNSNKQIVFNQFMGKVAEAKALSYQLEVYTADGLLRTITLGSTLKHNMQLVFRGNLLENSFTSGQFEIVRNETWGGQESHDF